MRLMEHILSILGFPQSNVKRDAETNEFTVRVANVRRLSEKVSELLDKDVARNIHKAVSPHGND